MKLPPYITDPFPFPDFYSVTMNYPSHKLEDPEGKLTFELEKQIKSSGIKKKDTVAIAVGSRGITGISFLVKTLCDMFRQKGAKPFIVPAMGSHGGGTEEGQVNVLATLGITDKDCGVSIVSSMDTVVVGTVFGDVPVCFSKSCLTADHSICINRVKPHTKFKGDLESGLAKMLCVGMGKHQGAHTYHHMALKYGFYKLLKKMTDEILKKTNFRFGIGIVEDAHDNTMEIKAVAASSMLEEEAKLLKLAKANFPALPVKKLDVLVLGRIGKEISGSGMDPNVTGRTYDYKEDDFSDSLEAKRVVVLDLTDESDGNGIGLGNADIISQRVYSKLDYRKTLVNALTSRSLRKAFIPVTLPNDRFACQAAVGSIGPVLPADLRMIMIQDTLNISKFYISASLYKEINSHPFAEIGKKAELKFSRENEIFWKK